MGGAKTAVSHFRAHARRRVSLRGVVRDPTRPAQLRVAVRDLGLGGAGIEWEVRAAAAFGPLAQGARLTIEITAPTLWDPLVLPVTLAWLLPHAFGARAGLAFEHREAGSVLALLQLLSAQAYA